MRVRFLLGFVAGQVWEQVFGGLLGRFFSGDADGAAGLQIAKRGGDFAPVAELQRALAEAAVGDEGYCVGDAAVDFDVGDDAFAFGDGVEAELANAQHGQAHTQHLTRAEVAVGDGGEFEIFGQGLHKIHCSSGLQA